MPGALCSDILGKVRTVGLARERLVSIFSRPATSGSRTLAGDSRLGSVASATARPAAHPSEPPSDCSRGRRSTLLNYKFSPGYTGCPVGPTPGSYPSPRHSWSSLTIDTYDCLSIGRGGQTHVVRAGAARIPA